MSESERPVRSDLPAATLTGMLVAVLHPLRFGYVYGSGDHDDLLPPILAWLKPGAFAHDVYVQSQMTRFSIRSMFQTIVRSTNALLPLPTAIGWLHILTSVAVGAGVYLLARSLRAGRTASVLASLLACVVVPNATIGGNAILYSLLTPEGIAWAFALPALVLFVRKRRLWSAALLGFTAWLHLLVGGLLAITLTLVALAEAVYWREGWLKAAAFAGLSALVALPFALPAILRQVATRNAPLPDGLDPFTLYAVLRLPHHYLPFSTSVLVWAVFLVVAGLGIAGFVLARNSRRPPDIRFPLRFAGAAVAMMVIATLAIYGVESLTAARAQTFKLTIVLNVLACIGLAAGVYTRIPRSLRYRTDRALRKKPKWLLGSTVLLFFVAVAARWAPERDNARAIGRWAYSNSPQQAVFAVPPSMSGFRVRSERSVVGTWKSVPFRTDLAAEWWRRLTLLAPLGEPPTRGAGLVEALDAAYARQSDEARLALADSFGVAFAIVPDTVQTELEVVHEESPWRVLRLE